GGVRYRCGWGGGGGGKTAEYLPPCACSLSLSAKSWSVSRLSSSIPSSGGGLAALASVCSIMGSTPLGHGRHCECPRCRPVLPCPRLRSGPAPFPDPPPVPRSLVPARRSSARSSASARRPCSSPPGAIGARRRGGVRMLSDGPCKSSSGPSGPLRGVFIELGPSRSADVARRQAA